MKNEKIQKIFEQFKKIFQYFPLTLITIIILTIIYILDLDTNLFSYDVLSNISAFGFSFGFTCFFIENVFSSKSQKYKVILYLINVIFSFLITLGLHTNKDILGLANEKFTEYVLRFFISYLICIFIYTIKILYKKTNFKFNEYLIKVAVSAFKNSIIYMLLSIGSLLICLAVISLLLESNSYMLIARVQILLLGFFYIPTLLYSLTGEEKEIGKFSKIIIKYVLQTLIFIAFLILYSYIIKIIVSWQLPSNEIFRICAGLFILGCPIWTISSYYNYENDLYKKINEKLPYAFIPFVLLQIYSIYVRISSYGLTTVRYLCVILILLEIIYLIIYFKSKEHIEKNLSILIVLVLISGIVPYINMFKLSQISQYNNLKIVKQKTNLTDDEKSKVSAAYNYLKYSYDGEKLINELLTDDEKEKISNFNTYKNEFDEEKSLYARNYISEIIVEDYNKIYPIQESNYSKNFNSKDIKDFIIIPGNTQPITFDLEKIFNNYINHNDSFEEYFRKNNEYIIDNNTKLIIENISIYYSKNSKEIKSYSFNGYVLIK